MVSYLIEMAALHVRIGKAIEEEIIVLGKPLGAKSKTS